MGTKDKPGNYDCYGKAAPDEPIFILRANDPNAPLHVMLWVAARNRDYAGIVRIALSLVRASKADTRLPMDEAKGIEALRVASAMMDWKLVNPPITDPSGKKVPLLQQEYEAENGKTTCDLPRRV